MTDWEKLRKVKPFDTPPKPSCCELARKEERERAVKISKECEPMFYQPDGGDPLPCGCGEKISKQIMDGETKA